MRTTTQIFSSVKKWLISFAPNQVSVNRREQLRASFGALLGLFMTAVLSNFLAGTSQIAPLLIAPIGASTVLLFALPSSPLAQPWAIMGGNVISAIVGVTCVYWIADPNWSAAVAVSGAIAIMFLLRCLHPPGGAIALLIALNGAGVHAQGYWYVLSPVALNSGLLLLMAVAYNNLTRHSYPHQQQTNAKHVHDTKDTIPSSRIGFTSADLDAVIQQYNEVLDISRDDLESLFKQTEMQVYQRRFRHISCADIMSRDIVSVEFGTSLEEAWQLLRQHEIKALPVLDRARRVIGIVTLVDFMKHANLDVHPGFDAKLRHFIKRTRDLHSSKAEVVGQIMTSPVHTANDAVHVVELVPLLSDDGMHHIPIVDHERRLVGMVTQSDLLAALYRDRLLAPDAIVAEAAI